MDNEINNLSARSLASAIHGRKISAREALDAHLAQIDAVNPAINAIVTLDREAALAAATAADELTVSGVDLPPLHGIPMTHKDTHNTKGLRTTHGSPVFQDNVPDFDDLIVQRLKSAGVVTTGKSNVPEFAAGSHTFNEVFGTTTNPYATSLSAGGSSGGAAAAIAARIQAFGDGSDMGGSLRIPASFCNIAGFRPSAGIVPMLPSPDVFTWLGRVGPMAREISDIALMMSVIGGAHPRSPITNPVPPARFTEPLERDLTGLRIGYSPDFGIGVPVEPEVRRTLEKQLGVFEQLGARVEQAAPDLREADMVFANVRAMEYALKLGDVVREHGAIVKPEVRWNVEKGWALTSRDWVETTLARTRLEMHVQDFFDRYDVFVSPSTQVLPFDASLRFPTVIDGSELETYLDWMRSACLISATGLPALSVPAGFSDSGLPVGMQMVMNHGEDFELLQVGYAFEQATGFARQAPAPLTS
ncbi:amidase [Cryobacterium levicorallinum]|uniref:Amidase n=1 Tax=Cryobacterium levicorallinum TaxID=995038 RepID=A0A1I3AQ25_9MICO|nr:amidase [Cryobacterium levicorallinum]TFB88055.1 amidase [Cryobacterium levicorallinum]GEP26745.1 amidase [Cryobacterium levicorallinum]SFH51896.1 amidase [Cryobacterium levicorallinum]